MSAERLTKIQVPRLNWSRVLAFAWINPEVLQDLRKDPRATILQLAQGATEKYPNVDDDTAKAADEIKNDTEEDPRESYRGYLPLPNPLKGLEKLTLSELEDLLRNGIDGILKFDDEAELWAKELQAAWQDLDKLKAIRQDPLNNLTHKDAFLQNKYGILPVPDRPRGLDNLAIKDLSDFLGDGDNMSHLGGIFLFGT